MNSMSVADPSIKIGELMLQGYTLLAHHCPRCNTPLVSKKSSDMLCVKCDMTVVLESAVPVNYSTTPRTKGASPPRPGSLESVATATDPEASSLDRSPPASPPRIPSSYEELKREYDAKNKIRDQVSAKLGEYMLKGWAMLGTLCPVETCVGTPLMRNKNDGNMICVSCERRYKFDGTSENLIIINHIISDHKKAVTSITDGATTSTTCAAPGISTTNINGTDSYASPMELPMLRPPKAVDESDPSLIMSKKLLQGWAMLDKVCDSISCNGNVPLMRDKSGQIQCVVCGSKPGTSANVISAETLESKKQLQSTSNSTSNAVVSTLPTKSAIRKDSFEAEAEIQIDNSNLSYEKKKRSDIMAGSLVQEVTAPHVSGVANSNALIQSSISMGALAALRAVESRMCSLSEELESSTDVSRSMQLADLLLKLTDVAKALQ
jgi:uncharacterized Zn finger protein (UPF0148 family)